VTPPAVLDNGSLRATVTPGLGGCITALCHLPTGAELLARTPWTPIADPIAAAPDEAAWLARFPGGWPLLFPNAGDACRDGPARHGFHGEGSLAPWTACREDDTLVLSRHFRAVPVRMTRRLRLSGTRLEVAETVTAEAPCRVVWGQHVTFGADLLGGPVSLRSSAARLMACAAYDPPANPLRPGASGDWPCLPGRRGPVDLSQPPEGAALLACLADLGPAPWAEIRRSDRRLAARLDWTADPWPFAWLWIETGGTADPPWFGRGRMIGIEPCTTWPATGLAAARAAGGPVLALATGETRRSRITLTVACPDRNDSPDRNDRND
jgi:hypothetical protein